MKNTKPILNQKILLTAGVVLTLFLIILVIVDINHKKATLVADQKLYPETTKQANQTEPIIPKATDAFRAEVPKDIVVPEMNTNPQTLTDKEIVIPSLVAQAAPGAESKLRSFSISADKNEYNPSKIIAYVGDTVHVSFTAVDKDYDIVFPNYNMMQQAKKGQTKILEFQALQEGDFLYYCDVCGGPNSQTKGHIIIVNKK